MALPPTHLDADSLYLLLDVRTSTAPFSIIVSVAGAWVGWLYTHTRDRRTLGPSPPPLALPRGSCVLYKPTYSHSFIHSFVHSSCACHVSQRDGLTGGTTHSLTDGWPTDLTEWLAD